MSETQDVKVVDDVENIENKIKNIGINNNEEKKLQKCASIDSYKDTIGTIDPVVKAVIEDKNKVGVKDQVPVDESSRQNSIEGAKNVAVKKPMSPFAKFRALDRQNSLQQQKSAPSSPGFGPRRQGSEDIPKFIDQDSVVQIKERLLSWCREKTQEYENVKLENFSTSWNDGLAFCALIHHFCPDAFDYQSLKPEDKRKNFELAFKKADEVGIFPLLDVEDMVVMSRPDWKCVFTYVQSIWRQFKDKN